MNTPQIYFDHEKLVAYQRSIQFVVWVARTPTIPEPRYAALVARAEALGFDLSRLISSTAHRRRVADIAMNKSILSEIRWPRLFAGLQGFTLADVH